MTPEELLQTRTWLADTDDDAPCTAGLARRLLAALDEARRERDEAREAAAADVAALRSDRASARTERDAARNALRKALDAASSVRAAAIEECAKVCEEQASEWWRMGERLRRDACVNVAARLRALAASEPQ